MPSITVLSFSYKRGIPPGADLLFDVRFLKNPHYDPALTYSTGLDTAAGAYIETDAQFAPFFAYITALVCDKLPEYLSAAKPDFTVAFGCTGGRHRSVYVAQKLTGILGGKGYNVTVNHTELAYVG